MTNYIAKHVELRVTQKCDIVSMNNQQNLTEDVWYTIWPIRNTVAGSHKLAYKNAAFLSSRSQNWPSKLKLRNNQTVYGTSTCGFNNNTIFQKDIFLSFLPSTYAGHVSLATVRPWWCMPKCQDGATVKLMVFFVFKMSLLPNYCVKYYDYIVKWCSDIVCNWYVSLDIALFLALTRDLLRQPTGPHVYPDIAHHPSLLLSASLFSRN